MLTQQNTQNQELKPLLVNAKHADANKLLDEKIKEYAEKHPEKLAELEKIEFKRRKKKYKPRRWRGHAYGYRLLKTIAYHLQAYYFAYGLYGKRINPSRWRLASEIDICLATFDKGKAILKAMGVIDWISGKKTWETNTYFLAPCYLKTPMRHPGEGYSHPQHLWFKLNYNLKIKKFASLSRLIFEHLVRDIRHHILRIREKIRSYEEKKLKKMLKEALNPKKTRGPPILWHLLKPFSLSFKDRAILSSYGEATLRPAIDDLNKYKEWKKKVDKEVAFLISRCRYHKEQLKQREEVEKPCTPEEALDWLKGFLNSNQKKLKFIVNPNDIDRSKPNKKPLVMLRISVEKAEKSVLKIFQKVQDVWTDKEFPLTRPDFKKAVYDFFETSFKTARKTYS